MKIIKASSAQSLLEFSSLSVYNDQDLQWLKEISAVKVDLHCHSFFSDGGQSPEELVERAIAADIQFLALTDHDTVVGLPRLHAAAKGQSIQIINGVEISVRWRSKDVHILGLHIDFLHPELSTLLSRQSEQRKVRAMEMSERLCKMLKLEGLYQKACEGAGHDRIGRPHLAAVLVNEGIVPNMETAFKRYLARGRVAYVPTAWASVEEAVAVITAASGVAVIAHPLKYKFTRTKLHTFIQVFKEAGGVGIEVVSGEMTPMQVQEMAGLCERFECFASTGSDFHSDTHSRIKLGAQRQLPVNCKPIWNSWV